MARTSGFHENLQRKEKHKSSSDRSFCLVFAGVFGVMAAAKFSHHSPIAYPFAGLAVTFLLVGLIKPSLAHSLNALWGKLGLLLAKVTNPIILTCLYFIAIMPFGLVRRAMGKDPLRLKPDANTNTYWIARTPPGPAPDSMNNQF